MQNHLLDGDNDPGVNSQRTQARANIGAAYVNGSVSQNFNSNTLTAASVFTANNTVNTHTLGGLTVTNNLIKGLPSTGVKVQSTTTTGTGSGIGSFAHFTDGSIDIVLGEIPSTTYVRFKDTDGTVLMVLDRGGNLYVKGTIYAKGNIEAFDTNNITTVGIV